MHVAIGKFVCSVYRHHGLVTAGNHLRDGRTVMRVEWPGPYDRWHDAEDLWLSDSCPSRVVEWRECYTGASVPVPEATREEVTP